MTREIAPEEAHSIAPEIAGDRLAPAGVTGGAERLGSTDPHAQGRTARLAAATAPLDHAAIRSIIAGIMLAMFLSALEQTIVAPALPAIGKSLGGIDELSWIVTAYLLAATAATPLFGKLSDIYGRRAIMLLAIGIFIVGSIACALAPSIWLLILARGLQGIGGGGLLPIAQTIIADLLTPRERPLVQGRTSIMFMSASILGPVLGGFITDHLHWSVIFWINLPLGAGALVMTDRALRRLPRHDRPHKLDVAGAALMVGAALALMFALTWGGSHYPWSSWPIVTLLAGSVALWVLFALRLLTAREPFIPLAILRSRITSTITCAAFFAIGAVIGVTIYTPLYCQVVLRTSASMSGITLIAFMAGATGGSMVTGRLVARLKHYMRVPIVGLVIAIAALVALAVDPAGRSLGEAAALLFALGAGVGPMYPMSTVIMQNGVEPHQLGTATGTLNFFRLLGGAIVVAAFGAIILGSVSDTTGVVTLEKVAAGHGDFAMAFRWVYTAAAVCLGIALACVLTVEERPLHGPIRVAETAAE